ncbi:DUF917 domain-containing protein [Cohnella thermotolerans]|uniref:DUF917 domain-containing protein n=1 Tax=Cohnella thermotolerans TaxID=329858 RepID=UPI0004154E8F|nr:DUF917 domain-containing protein [Cohnella thermotolerans]
MAWKLTEDHVRSIAIGAGVLGTGGGGDTYLGELQLIRLLRQGKTVEVVSVSELDDEAEGCAVGGMGAPTVSIEKLPAGDEMWRSVQALERHLNTRFSFLVVAEIGGGNALNPLIAAAYSGVPVVDADPMGRAFPELQMDTFMIGGVSPSPFALADGEGNSVIFNVNDALTGEKLGRALTVAMGGSAALAMPYVKGKDVRAHAIHGSITLCRQIGDAVRAALRDKTDISEAIASVVPARPLFTGKVTDVEVRTTGGFSRGFVALEGLDACAGRELRIDIQNEYLVAWEGDQPIATVPDLICVLDQESGMAVGTESLKYNMRMRVLGIPASEKLRTNRALTVVGPRQFGYDLDFVPLQRLR